MHHREGRQHGLYTYTHSATLDVADQHLFRTSLHTGEERKKEVGGGEGEGGRDGKGREKEGTGREEHQSSSLLDPVSEYQ